MWIHTLNTENKIVLGCEHYLFLPLVRRLRCYKKMKTLVLTDVKKRFSDEYNNYNLLWDTLNTDYKIVLSCKNIALWFARRYFKQR